MKKPHPANSQALNSLNKSPSKTTLTKHHLTERNIHLNFAR